MCKHSNVLSRPVLIIRGLDFRRDATYRSGVLRVRATHPAALLGQVSGGHSEGETPLPIPNRAVKPLSADGTWCESAWESRSPPGLPWRAVREGGPSYDPGSELSRRRGRRPSSRVAASGR